MAQNTHSKLSHDTHFSHEWILTCEGAANRSVNRSIQQLPASWLWLANFLNIFVGCFAMPSHQGRIDMPIQHSGSSTSSSTVTFVESSAVRGCVLHGVAHDVRPAFPNVVSQSCLPSRAQPMTDSSHGWNTFVQNTHTMLSHDAQFSYEGSLTCEGAVFVRVSRSFQQLLTLWLWLLILFNICVDCFAMPSHQGGVDMHIQHSGSSISSSTSTFVESSAVRGRILQRVAH